MITNQITPNVCYKFITIYYKNRMKKILLALVALFVATAPAVKASTDIRDLLGSLAGGGASSDSGQGTSALGGALGGLISGLLGNGQLTEADLAGVYAYKEPAITFESDNLLQQAGGAAIAAPIVNKLAPYYEKAGMKKLVVTLTPEKNFEFTLGKVKLSGTFERDSTQSSSNTFIFNFKALGKIKFGKLNADVQKTPGGLIITFDATKLLSLINTVSKLTGQQTLQAAASFLNSYEGLNCGFSLTKTADVAPAAGTTSGYGTSGASSAGSAAKETTDSAASSANPIGSLLDLLRR